MRRTTKRITLLSVAWIGVAASLSVLTGPPARGFDLRDATGVLVHIVDHPIRIVTLAPSVAELTAEFLGMDLQRIVGVSEGTDYPPGLEKAESIGQYQRFNLEKVVALKPDLVLATEEGNAKDQVLHLREMGLPVFVLSTGDLSKIETAMNQVARLLGDAKDGERVVSAFKKHLAELSARGSEHANSPRRVLIQLGSDPLIVAGGGSFLDEALRTVGAINVYGDLKSGYPKPSLEDALRRNPDTILVMAFGRDLSPFSRMAGRWAQYPALAAVREKRVEVVYEETLLRPSMRLLEGLGVLEKVVYGGN